MSFKKLNIPLKESLERLGITTPTLFQATILPKVKGGADVFGIAPEGSGKTTAMIINTMQKLKSEAFDDSPRALIFVKDKKAALNLEEEFKKFTKGTDLRVYSVYDEQGIDHQKDDIYYGVDVIIATPKRLNKLYHINGVHLGELQLLIVEDAEFLAKNSLHADIARLTESIKKCQYLIFADRYYPKFDRFQNSFMSNAQLIEL
ncbi:MAG: DEAD/DEAH box helicase [Kordia sp.]|nr:MAG: DEAD/DEAH box helicase [Kordia sp.]